MKKFLLSALIGLGLVTTVNSQVCGGIFTDPAGATANYANASDYTVTINPIVPGDVVTVTFTEFSTEFGFDALYVFDGPSIASPQIASTNLAASVPGGLAGGYWGTTIPGPFTSSDPSGSLTFRFRSDNFSNRPGWIANVTCGPPPQCLRPTLPVVSSVTHNSAVLGWTENNSATTWELIAIPCGDPVPTATSVGEVITSNPYTITDLVQLTCYTYFVRSICPSSGTSQWAGPFNFTTIYGPPPCGGEFTDNGPFNSNYLNNSDDTVTICPETANSSVTVTFTSFGTEVATDALYIFDGNSINAPQIESPYGAGSIPGGLAGGYSGGVNPGSFTSSDPSGCLTFRFRSDNTVNYFGWTADVTCGPQASCLKPNGLTTSVTPNSVTLDWIDNNAAESWEVLYLPCGSPVPTAGTTGETVDAHPTTFQGLEPSTCYDFYVRSNCDTDSMSSWSLKKPVTTGPVNDDCINAIIIPVSANSCASTVHGTTTSATPSSQALACAGIADDDVWFKFTATNTDMVISISNVNGNFGNNLVYVLYTGSSCGALTEFHCSPAIIGSLSESLINNLTVGQSYYVRVYSNSGPQQLTGFDICIHSVVLSTCATSQSVCGLNNYPNKTGIPDTGTIGCLTTTPNPTYFSLKIAQSGPVNLFLTSFTAGSASPNIDVDYAAWGPFASNAAACAAISSGQAPGIGVPLTLTTGCSYAPTPTENLNIANAVAGEYYIVLITNYSNIAGYINLEQTNAAATGAGSIDCSGIRLNAFIDANSNGVQDSGELNFPLGQFQYSNNTSPNVHNITASSGIHNIYDDYSSNTYNLNYVINPEFSAVYSSSANYTNVVVAAGGLTTYNFPITSLQNYTDVGVTLVPLSSPRAGATYLNKIVYTNNGNQTIASGTLTFDRNSPSAITSVSQAGTTAIPNGFTYNYTNLLPFESRNIIVTMSVPAIPVVNLGQLLTNTVAVTPASGDFISNNNNSSLTQVVTGSYDPNDKSESHGGKIQFSSFTANDYLYYTIRFENTGTASALNVVVTDLLNEDLDENSLVMINTSHSYTLDRVDKSLVWSFNNIQLPVSVANTTVGKGYINFKIKPKTGYAVGDIIPNTASIYFDSNPAIITNTFDTEFVQSLGLEDYDFANLFVLSPVPVKNVLNITIKQSVTINSISIYNTLGQLVELVSNPAETIDVSRLTSGTYFIKILSDRGTASSKFVKE
jgi:uncharacterized repeat protein (TIGR01451 family)